MKVVLFASPWNPLSAEAALFFRKKGMLEAIVIPRGQSTDLKGGVVYFLSMVCVAFYRCLHWLSRCMGIKRSENYLSLLEFLKSNPEVPVFKVTSCEADFKEAPCFKDLEEKGEEYIGVSCIFPFKIPVDVLPLQRLINIHPGILPQNRGSSPYFWALAKEEDLSGISYHVLTSQFDQGPVLLKEVFSINPKMSEYSLEAMAAKYLKESLPLFFKELEQLWVAPTVQEDGNYHSQPSFQDRRKYHRQSVL
ncbi:MAG: hypothetical protein KAS92_08225 [Candidatus Omnitrophica bacterium]|nr:hypothetical protein [Candidatus Omnitrophota bacterium]